MLALGGGGYDVMAVARAWTLAYGVMVGTEWSDDIPGNFARQHGVSVLRDTITPEIPDHIRQEAVQFAEQSTGKIKELVFPRHGLTK